MLDGGCWMLVDFEAVAECQADREGERLGGFRYFLLIRAVQRGEPFDLLAGRLRRMLDGEAVTKCQKAWGVAGNSGLGQGWLIRACGRLRMLDVGCWMLPDFKAVSKCQAGCEGERRGRPLYGWLIRAFQRGEPLDVLAERWRRMLDGEPVSKCQSGAEGERLGGLRYGWLILTIQRGEPLDVLAERWGRMLDGEPVSKCQSGAEGERLGGLR